VANTQAISGVMKQVALAAVVDSKSLKAALYLASATTNGANTVYTSTGEVSGSGYTAGGVSVTNANAAGLTSTTAYWTPSAQFQWTSFTSSGSFDCVQIYNSTHSNKTVSVHTFSAQSITAGTFNLTMPTNRAGTAILNIA